MGMDGSIHNRALTHLLSLSRWASKSPQLLGNSSPLRNRNGSGGVPIGGPHGKRIPQGQLGGRSGERSLLGIPMNSWRWIGARKEEGSTQRAITGYGNGIDIDLLNPVDIQGGCCQGQRGCGHAQRPQERWAADKLDQLGRLDTARCIGEIRSIKGEPGQRS